MSKSLMQITSALAGVILIFVGFGIDHMPGLLTMFLGLGMILFSLYLYNKDK